MSGLDFAVLAFLSVAIARLLVGEATSARWSGARRVLTIASVLLALPFLTKVASVIGPILVGALR